MTSSAVGDTAIVLAVADSVSPEMVRRAQAVATAIERQRLPAVTDVVPAFASVAVYYEPARLTGFNGLQRDLERIAEAALALSEPGESRRIEIPVVYGGEHGPDLEHVARHGGLSPADVAARHAAADYFVNAIGFVPGFPYLGGLPPALATPRRAQPRPEVPAGTVGIGGTQTGVYPFRTPGGWNLIGRTPLRLFDPEREQPALLRAGDAVTFRAITAEEFAERVGAANVVTAAPAGKDAPHTCEVLRPGMYTTVQDLGRVGFRAAGVVQGGAADPFALRVANLLAGNPPDAAALEFTLEGPELRFEVEAIVALAGAEVDGFPAWQAWRVAAGEVLTLGRLRRGCRGYLAIGGGIQVPETLGSRSTYDRAGFGGWQGRALRAGDRLPLAPNGAGIVHGRIDPHILPRYRERARVRVVLPETSGALATELLSREFAVSSQSDRMGLRLAGPALTTSTRGDLGSAPVTPGTIQVPPDGRPIVLLRDAQTIGGYEPVAHAITVDLPVLAQLRPGDRVHFVEVSLAEAHDLAVRNERALGLLAEGLAGRRR